MKRYSVYFSTGRLDRTRLTNTLYRSTRALFNTNSHYAHAQDHHRTLLFLLQSYDLPHRPKSPILISILIPLGTSNRVSAVTPSSMIVYSHTKLYDSVQLRWRAGALAGAQGAGR
eukprot:COSAG05_NODE_9760_length_603_cov_0.684524_1_plen_115_part_01